MKKSTVTFILCIIVLLLCFSCSKEKKPTGPTDSGLTEAEKQAIIEAHDSVAVTADSVLLTDDPIKGFKELLPSYQSYANVESAWVTDNALYVRYEKGGVESWIITPNVIIPPWAGPSTMRSMSKLTGIKGFEELIGNNKVCLINQMYKDERFQKSTEDIDSLSDLFQNNGFEVTVKNGGDADLEFFGDSLSDFGVIFIHTHGSYDGKNTWLLTGEELNAFEDFFLNDDIVKIWSRWEIGIVHTPEKRNGKCIGVSYYKISQRFIGSKYSEGDFPHSLVYLTACEGLKSTDHFAKIFNKKGVAVTIGWDEVNNLGIPTGKLLFESLLLRCYNLETAFESLRDEAKKGDNYFPPGECRGNITIPEGANLTYYPTSGGSVKLCEVPLASCGDFIGMYRSIVAKSNGQYAGKAYSCEEEIGDYGYRYQCVEYVNRFYHQAMGVDEAINWNGNGADYYESANKDFVNRFGNLIKNKKLDPYSNGGGIPPEPDDILCFDDRGYGHAAIIMNVGNDYLEIIEQNWKRNYAYDILEMKNEEGRFRIPDRGSYKIQGWLRLPQPSNPPKIEITLNKNVFYVGDRMRLYYTTSTGTPNIVDVYITFKHLDSGHLYYFYYKPGDTRSGWLNRRFKKIPQIEIIDWPKGIPKPDVKNITAIGDWLHETPAPYIDGWVLEDESGILFNYSIDEDMPRGDYRLETWLTRYNANHEDVLGDKSSVTFEVISEATCFIATAVYGTPMAKQVQILREFRDRYLLTNWLGCKFVHLYNKWSPPVAEYISKDNLLKTAARTVLVPLILIAELLLKTTLVQKIIIGCFCLLLLHVAVRKARTLSWDKKRS